jgi:DNA-binding MarR family transcriptional regulator
MRLEEAIQQRTFDDVYHRLAINLIYTTNHLANRFDQAFEPHDISQAQFNVLRILKGRHPRPMSGKEIRERMLDPMSNTSRLVEKLRNKGLVERTACARDRRAVDILLTPDGLAKLATLNALVRDLNRNYRTLSEDEAAQLNDLLDRLRG